MPITYHRLSVIQHPRVLQDTTQVNNQSYIDTDIPDNLAKLSNDYQFMHHLIQNYLRDQKILLDKIERTITKKKYSESSDLLHAIKGSALHIGANAFASQAGILRKYVNENDTDKIIIGFRELESTYHHTEQAFQAYLEYLKNTMKVTGN